MVNYQKESNPSTYLTQTPLGPIIIYGNLFLVKNPLKKKLENFIVYKNNPNVYTKYDRHNKEYSDQIKI
jgi:hypothetical protein